MTFKIYQVLDEETGEMIETVAIKDSYEMIETRIQEVTEELKTKVEDKLLDFVDSLKESLREEVLTEGFIDEKNNSSFQM